MERVSQGSRCGWPGGSEAVRCRRSAHLADMPRLRRVPGGPELYRHRRRSCCGLSVLNGDGLAGDQPVIGIFGALEDACPDFAEGRA